MVHLGSRAVGGAGLVLTEATAVSPEGRITPNDLGIWKDEHLPLLKRITDFINRQGAVAGIQLAHAGRKASCSQPWKGGQQLSTAEGGWNVIAPSPLPFTEGTSLPVELSSEGITKVMDDFKKAALRAWTAGFRVIEIHAAHGYLLHEFLSPLSNHRQDNYGGSFENRIRLLLEVVQGIRTVWPVDLPLFVRISASEWTEGGWNEEDSVLLAKRLGSLGVDLIDCSSGGNVPHVKIPLRPGYQVPFAEKIKRETGILTGAVGLITDAKQAESILTQKQADLVLLAREFLWDAYFPLHAARELGVDVPWPVQYTRAKK
jgi:2,4-dienoyl-CoA reductase-like NADH-dependent reductase (Old Yellow Enzyme family)